VSTPNHFVYRRWPFRLLLSAGLIALVATAFSLTGRRDTGEPHLGVVQRTVTQPLTQQRAGQPARRHYQSDNPCYWISLRADDGTLVGQTICEDDLPELAESGPPTKGQAITYWTRTTGNNTIISFSPLDPVMARGNWTQILGLTALMLLGLGYAARHHAKFKARATLTRKPAMVVTSIRRL
jgi:hypothetical protein